MSDRREHDDERERGDQREQELVRDLVKRALPYDELAKSAPDILRGVQRRLRQRSRGTFFARGWSTSQVRQTRLIYVVLALLTLVLVAVAYFGLLPVAIR
jgi:hypothetical protein